MQTHEVQAGLAGGDSPLLHRLAIGSEDRQVDPGEAG